MLFAFRLFGSFFCLKFLLRNHWCFCSLNFKWVDGTQVSLYSGEYLVPVFFCSSHTISSCYFFQAIHISRWFVGKSLLAQPEFKCHFDSYESWAFLWQWTTCILNLFINIERLDNTLVLQVKNYTIASLLLIFKIVVVNEIMGLHFSL